MSSTQSRFIFGGRTIFCTFEIPTSMTVKQVVDGSGKVSAPEYTAEVNEIPLKDIAPAALRLGNGLGDPDSHFFGSTPEKNPEREGIFIQGTSQVKYKVKFKTDRNEILRGTGTAYEVKVMIMDRVF